MPCQNLVKTTRRMNLQQRRNPNQKKRQCKLTEGLTAEERALDDSSNNGDNNREAPNQSNKGKWKASNAYNINPKSCGTPGTKTPDPFTLYEEYASKQDAGVLLFGKQSLLVFHLS